MKRAFIIGMIILIAAALSISIYKIIKINQKIPAIEVVEHSANEEVRGGDLSVKVLEATFCESSFVEELDPSYFSFFQVGDASTNNGDFKFVFVEVEVRNYADNDLTFDFMDLALQSGAWANHADIMLVDTINQPENDNLFQIAAQGSKTFTLPYLLHREQFGSGYNWQNAHKREFDLVLSYYPVNNIVHLSALSKE